MEKQELALNTKVMTMWKTAIESVDLFVSKRSLSMLNECESIAPVEEAMSTFPMEMFHLKRLAYNRSEGIIDKLVNVYASMNSIGATLFTIIHGDISGNTDYYIGCLSRNNAEEARILLKSNFEGNFPGIELEEKNSSAKNELLDDFFPLNYSKKSIASVSVSADFRKNKTEEKIDYIQGIEKFIDTMKGKSYTVLFLAEPISREDCCNKKISYESIITELSKYSKMTLNYSENDSTAVNETLSEGVSNSISRSISNSVSKTTSYSIGKNKNKNSGHSFGLFGIGNSFGSSRGTSETNTTGDSSANVTTDGSGSSSTRSKASGTSTTTGSSVGMSVNIENKTITNIVSKLEYELKKLESADSFGLWDTAVYIVSDEVSTSIIGANSIRALVIGDESGKAESYINYWDNTEREFTCGAAGNVMRSVHYGLHPVFRRGDNADSDYFFTPAVSVGGNVLPSLIGLPMKSIPGITVIEAAEFGRNLVTDDHSDPGNRKIRLGEIMYMGKKDNTEVKLYVNSFSMHTFICGAPGSGKSNTVYKILYELCRLGSKPERDDGFGSVKFLVIEPAKGEYKYEFGKMAGINIFTTRNGLCNMLCINPFEFPYEKMDVREHIERIKNILSACWPLTGAMPSILSTALERSFIKTGWDVENSMYVFPGAVKFPGFGDLLSSLQYVIDASDYSAQAKGDYRGALLTRVQSLTKGIAGAVFTDIGAVPDEMLFDENAIIDLSMVGSSETRSLIMGILIMKLENYRKATATQSNYPLRHVTVLEEAHNLLPRCSTEQNSESSNIQGKSVEAISAAISEMRTYGEGYIIVDQSPSAVADVAVSNTSTKIIMRLPGQDDVQAAGSSIGLDEQQLRQIPMLPQGQAIVKQSNWIAPVVALIDKAPVSYRTRKLKTYDYEDLMDFRAELIDKILIVYERNELKKEFPAADKSNILAFIGKHTEIAPDKLEKIKAYWAEFCSAAFSRRFSELNKLMLRILSLEDMIAYIRPPVMDEYDKETVDEWGGKIEQIIPAYVTVDSPDDEDSNLYAIRDSIVFYLAEYARFTSVKNCAKAAIKYWGLDR